MRAPIGDDNARSTTVSGVTRSALARLRIRAPRAAGTLTSVTGRPLVVLMMSFMLLLSVRRTRTAQARAVRLVNAPTGALGLLKPVRPDDGFQLLDRHPRGVGLAGDAANEVAGEAGAVNKLRFQNHDEMRMVVASNFVKRARLHKETTMIAGC